MAGHIFNVALQEPSYDQGIFEISQNLKARYPPKKAELPSG